MIHELIPRERVVKAFRRERPDKVPKDFECTPQIHKLVKEKTGSSDPLEYFGCEMRWIGWLPTKNKRDFSAYLGKPPSPFSTWINKGFIEIENNKVDASFSSEEEGEINQSSSLPWVDQEWGVGYIPPTSKDPRYSHLVRYIFPMRNLKTVEELKEYPFSDYEAEYRHKHLEMEVKKIHRKELCVTAGMQMTIFELSWQLTGMDKLFTDFVENKPFTKYLLDYVTEMRKYVIRRFTEVGVDHISLGDDIGTQRGMLMSPKTWREWFKERMRSIISVAKKVNSEVMISYHSDGNLEEVIPELIEIGIDVLNPVQPECMDPAKLKRKYGDKLAFWGTVGTQTTMPFGTPREVKKVVKKRIKTVGKNGGLLIAPTHALQPDVPWENILAFFEAVEKEGKY